MRAATGRCSLSPVSWRRERGMSLLSTSLLSCGSTSPTSYVSRPKPANDREGSSRSAALIVSAAHMCWLGAWSHTQMLVTDREAQSELGHCGPGRAALPLSQLIPPYPRAPEPARPHTVPTGAAEWAAPTSEATQQTAYRLGRAAPAAPVSAGSSGTARARPRSPRRLLHRFCAARWRGTAAEPSKDRDCLAASRRDQSRSAAVGVW